MCNGNSTCVDCAGVAHGNATVDQCGQCAKLLLGMCQPDCAGVYNGSSAADTCGVCKGTDACLDCAGVARGNSVVDQCGEC